MKKIGILTSFKLLKTERPDYFKIEIRIRLENGESESFKVGSMTKEVFLQRKKEAAVMDSTHYLYQYLKF